MLALLMDSPLMYVITRNAISHTGITSQVAPKISNRVIVFLQANQVIGQGFILV
jgi:hypothetical protein